MKSFVSIVSLLMLVVFVCLERIHAQTVEKLQAAIKPDVLALLRQSTEAYRDLKHYRHVERYTITELPSHTITLALDRPNRFCFRSEDQTNNAAVCDGKTLYNFKRPGITLPPSECLKTVAPATYDDMDVFEYSRNYVGNYLVIWPDATYMVARLLQGTLLTDEDYLRQFAKSERGSGTMPDGRKMDTIINSYGAGTQVRTLYFDAETHLLQKSVEHMDRRMGRSGGDRRVHSDTIEDLTGIETKTNAPASTYRYTPPPGARVVSKFTEPKPR